MAGSYISGVDSLRRTLRILPSNVTSEVRVAIASSAGMVLRQALANVPRNTGLLASQLRIVYGGDRMSAQIGIIGIRSGKKAYYAHWVEYGTVNQPAHPFLMPAFKSVGPQAVKLISAAVDRALERASSGAGPSVDGGGEVGGESE